MQVAVFQTQCRNVDLYLNCLHRVQTSKPTSESPAHCWSNRDENVSQEQHPRAFEVAEGAGYGGAGVTFMMHLVSSLLAKCSS